ncbi:type II toxin-antitoxin system RelE/ParE family toxin [Tautonia marina]|uniref:type II toxin-antitoxin system RelE/ParE family toxin n=1 Tax=Tautonia marina TaxID=2653855 RepID=UPI0012612045|nr:type II toxin-antitoxin system RelE/ParE family toxin [Tautonia marina]
MNPFDIEITATAKAELQEAAQRISEESSPAIAAAWLDRLLQTIDTLRYHPLRCPLARENDHFPEEIRVLAYGRHRSQRRILFTVEGSTVTVLYIRHGARGELTL